MPRVLDPAKERRLRAILEGVREDVRAAERRRAARSPAERERYEAAARVRLERDAGEVPDAARALRERPPQS